MKHNSYRDGNIQNLVFVSEGSEKSVGVIEKWSYSLTSEKEEIIQCLTGELEIDGKQCLPNQKIVIDSNKTFEIVAKKTSSYLCSYR